MCKARLFKSWPFLVFYLVAPVSWAGGEINESAATPGLAPAYHVCRAVVAGIGGGRMPITKKGVWYVSGEIAGNHGNDLKDVFAAFVAAKYAVEVSQSECASVADKTQLRLAVEMWKTQSSGQMADYVDTGWTPPAGSATAAPAASPLSSKSVTFTCHGGGSAFSVVGTYYFQQGRRTPVRVTATLNGKTTELAHDHDDTSGWVFAGADVGIEWNGTAGTARVSRGTITSQCVVH